MTATPSVKARLRTLAVMANFALTAAGLCAAAPAARAETVRAESVNVALDQAKIVRLPAKTQTVVVGNPGIADVSVQKNGVMVITGKSYGVTNLIALDSGGALLAESLVRVGAGGDSLVLVQRGLDQESYSCTPICQPSIQLGDAQTFFNRAGAQSQTRNAIANGGKQQR